MFSTLKDKLKSALSIFSKKAAEEADVKQIEVEKEVAVVGEKVPVVEKAVPVAKRVAVVTKVEPIKEKKVVEKKEEKKVTSEKVQQKVETTGKKNVLIFHGWEDTAESGFIPSLKEGLQSLGYEALSFNQPDTDTPKFEKWFSFKSGI